MAGRKVVEGGRRGAYRLEDMFFGGLTDTLGGLGLADAQTGECLPAWEPYGCPDGRQGGGVCRI